MALTAATVWEIRTTGSDTQCGGGFDATIVNHGTDYSQQDTAQATGTVTSATTTVTATTGIFTAAMIGNIITDGTTYKQITAFTSTTVITVDSAPAWTAATIYVGGALASPGKVAGLVVAGNDVFVKSGTYTISTTSSNVAGGRLALSTSGVSDANGNRWQGYGATRGDLGTKPILQVASSGVTSITVVAITGNRTYFDNFEIDGQSKSSIKGISTSGNGLLIRCTVRNCTNNGIDATFSPVYFCRVTGCTGGRCFNLLTGAHAFYCVADTSSSFGYVGSGGKQVGCLAYALTGASNSGFYMSTQDAVYINCMAYGNAASGFEIDTSGVFDGMVLNCLSTGNGGFGFKATASAQDGVLLVNCAGYSNTSGNTNANLTQLQGFVTLTADPFTNAAGGDFSLNSTAGGGAPCKAAGLPGAFPGGLTTGYIDIGAVQHASSGGMIMQRHMLGGLV